MSAAPRVLLMQLSERTSARGNRYLSGWLGKASVVAFLDEQPDKFGNPQWSVFVAEPQPRTDQRALPLERAGASSPGYARNGDAPANRSARPVERGDGWRGPSAYRRRDGAQRAPVADDGAFHEDGVDDLYR
jgi:hypothetical protein